MKIELSLSQQDWRRYYRLFHRHVQHQGFSSADKRDVIVNYTILALYIIAIASYFWLEVDFYPVAAILACMWGIDILRYYNHLRYRSDERFRPGDNARYLQVMVFDDEGLTLTRKGYCASASWEMVKKITREKGMILIYSDAMSAWFIPEEQLDDSDSFYEFITSRYQLSKAEADVEATHQIA